MRRPKLRELAEAFRSLFGRPATVRFPAAPSPAAPRFRGIMAFRPEECIGCGACVEVCPANARSLNDLPARRVREVIHRQDECVYCGQCALFCATRRGIYHTTDYDLAALADDGYVSKIEKELVFCERCGGVLTTRDQLRWVAERLGELFYDNPTLVRTVHDALAGAEPPSPRLPAYRFDHQRYLCPDCRRAVYLAEVWGY